MINRAASAAEIDMCRWLAGFLACPIAPENGCTTASRSAGTVAIGERAGIRMERLAHQDDPKCPSPATRKDCSIQFIP